MAFSREGGGGGFLAREGAFCRKPSCAMKELPLDLAPPAERARPRGLQQTWLAAPGGTPPPSPPRSASRLTPCSPSTPSVETHLSCGHLTDFTT